MTLFEDNIYSEWEEVTEFLRGLAERLGCPYDPLYRVARNLLDVSPSRYIAFDCEPEEGATRIIAGQAYKVAKNVKVSLRVDELCRAVTLATCEHDSPNAVTHLASPVP